MMTRDIEHDSRERLSNEAEHWWQCPDVVPISHYVRIVLAYCSREEIPSIR